MTIHLEKRTPDICAYFLLLLCVVYIACGSDTPGTPEDNQAACALPDTIDFGVVTVGTYGERYFEIDNTGGGTMSGSVSVSTSAPCDGYSIVTGGGDYSLTSGQFHTVIVRMEPATTGVKSCRIETGNSLCGDVILTGFADVVEACEVQPSNISFGLVTVGSENDTTFTITNSGGGVLSGSVAESCDHISIVSGGGSYRLFANASVEVTLRYKPTDSGAHTCTVETGNKLCGDLTVSGTTEAPRFVGTAVGFGGTILRTTDGGTTWARQTGGTSKILVDVYFTDTNTGTAVGQNGTILTTSDGGDNWTSQVSGTTEFLAAVWYTDTNIGTVVGQKGTILRTGDGGTTWVSQTSGTTEHLTSVSFGDANTGTVVGWNSVILRTTDGGTNWIPQNSGTDQFLRDVWFVDKNIGTAVTAGAAAPPLIPQILRTNNGGDSWTIQVPQPTGGLTSVVFTDASTGTVVGADGEIYRTTDGGITWSPQISGVTNLNGVSFVDLDNGIAVGFGGVIIQTLDGGATWIGRDSGTTVILRGVWLSSY